jgi:hypothetical protein
LDAQNSNRQPEEKKGAAGQGNDCAAMRIVGGFGTKPHEVSARKEAAGSQRSCEDRSNKKN